MPFVGLHLQDHFFMVLGYKALGNFGGLWTTGFGKVGALGGLPAPFTGPQTNCPAELQLALEATELSPTSSYS